MNRVGIRDPWHAPLARGRDHELLERSRPATAIKAGAMVRLRRRMRMMRTRTMSEVRILKAQFGRKRYTLGVVYEPDVKDTHGEFAKAEDIEKAAWSFMIRLQRAASIGRTVVKAQEGALQSDAQI